MTGTEDRNRASMALDQMSCEEIVRLMNREDQRMLKAVEAVLPDPDTGAEVLTGSTRLKAGSSQKLILNMISTSVMVRLG